jgi:hypothetical protein
LGEIGEHDRRGDEGKRKEEETLRRMSSDVKKIGRNI